jgi:group II intron reverse transcriptase/maturase
LCNQRAEDREIAIVLKTPEKIRTLQRKLYLKAKQEPAFRFYALYDKVCRADILNHAYNLVRANKGSAGIDGATFESIEATEGRAVFIVEIGEDLVSHTYKASPVRRVLIPKPDGSKRPLGIPTIRDRVIQMAVKLVIEPIFEADFCRHSYGFRPKKSAHDAIDAITCALNTGHTQVIDADLSKYFDTIPHDKLMTLVAKRISDGMILKLIRMWLKAPIVEEGEDGKRRNIGGGKKSHKGIPQGGVISPLLANIYLHILDRVWEWNNLQQKLGAWLVRYADDFVVLCREDTNRPMRRIQHVLTRLELELNESKTRVVDACVEGFDFLGYELRMRKSWKSGKQYAHVQPAKKSMKKIKDRITSLTRRERTLLPLDSILGTVNAALRGWVNYFHFRNCSKSLRHVRAHAEQRLRTHLCKRHKRKRHEGYHEYPNRVLYEKYGLYEVPITAGWTNAHAVR